MNMLSPHPLTGALQRIERAGKHLQEVVSEIETFRRAYEDGLVAEHDATTNEFTITVAQGWRIPTSVVLPISDCIHNFRAALDYLVYELARNDSGAIQDGTQFPIEDTPERFVKRRATYLKGLTDPHKDAIETYQPYKGVSWTKTLRSVSNPDKHRHLIPLGGPWKNHFTLIGGPPGSFEGRPGKVFQGIGADGCDVYVERQHAREIAFSDGLPVVETLEVLQSQVAATVDAFKSEFK